MTDQPGSPEPIDDALADALVAGEVTSPTADVGRLVAFLDSVRAVARERIPDPVAQRHVAAAIAAVGTEVPRRWARRLIVAGIVGGSVLGGAAAARTGIFESEGDTTPPVENSVARQVIEELRELQEQGVIGPQGDGAHATGVGADNDCADRSTVSGKPEEPCTPPAPVDPPTTGGPPSSPVTRPDVPGKPDTPANDDDGDDEDEQDEDRGGKPTPSGKGSSN